MIVEGLIGGACEFRLALGTRKLGRVFIGFFDQFFDSRARGIVVKEFMVSFFYACLGNKGLDESRDKEEAVRLERLAGGGGLHSLMSGK